VTNNGPSNAIGTVLSDTLPAGVTFVGATGATCTAAVSCPLDTVAAGATVTVTVTVLPDPALTEGAVLTNAATGSSTVDDPVPANNTGTVDVTVGPAVAQVTIAKEAPATMVAGQDATYTVTVTNAGPSVAHDVRGVDVLDPRLTFVSSSPDRCSAIGQTVTCSDPDIAVGDSLLLLTVHVAADVPAGTRIDNGATASTPSDPDGVPSLPPTPGPPVQTIADLSVTKTAPATVTAGAPFDYAVSVNNAGPSDAQAVTLTDTLPAGVTLVGATGATCSGTPVVCAVGAVPAGGLATVTLHVTPAPALPAGSLLDTPLPSRPAPPTPTPRTTPTPPPVPSGRPRPTYGSTRPDRPPRYRGRTSHTRSPSPTTVPPTPPV
jgi:uncharacterized repeat protein (TIGR01451 family)